MTAGVFVCHATEDAAVAHEVVEVLEAAGHPCWIAPRDIPPGSEYTAAILDALDATPTVLLIFSAASSGSPHVRRELETAIGRDTPLLPVRTEPVEPSPSLKYFIGSAQWLDTAGEPVAAWADRLVEAIGRTTGSARPAAAPARVVPAGPQSGPTEPAATWGREALVAEVHRLLDHGRDRVVTLTGVGGVGKSHVADQVAARLPRLAVLDDADPRALPAAGPVLATNRRPLGVPGERVVPVPPLDDASAAAYFVHTAATVAPHTDLSGDAATVAEVCRLVGGLPLGVRLAAERLRVVGLDRLVQGLTTDLTLVRDLAVVLGESLARLGPDERALLDRLVLLHGAQDVATVEALAEDDPIDTLTALVDAGLVHVVPGPRYAVPHPVRLLVRRELDGTDGTAARRAVADLLASRVAAWSAELDTAEGPQVQAAFAAAAPDLEAAVADAVEEGRTDAAFGLLDGARRLWLDAGRNTEPRELALRLVTVLGPDDPRAATLRAFLGRLAYQRTEWAQAEQELREAVRLGQLTDASQAVLDARIYLSGTLMMLGRVDEGTTLAHEVHAETTAAGLYPQTAEGLFMLALSQMVAGDVDAERRTHELRLEVVRSHGDVARTTDELNTLAEIALDEDDAAKARRYAQESLAVSGDRFPLQHRDALITLARAHAALGDHRAAATALGDAVAATGRHRQNLATAQCLRVAGVLAEAGHRADLAVRLFAAAQRLSPSPTGTDTPPEVDLAAALDRARTTLGEPDAEQEWTLGGALPLTAALAQVDEATGLFGS